MNEGCEGKIRRKDKKERYEGRIERKAMKEKDMKERYEGRV
jgi:hypothetical protein